MKVMTILGTRPEIIRLSLIIKKLDNHCKHILVHTGQNFNENLSRIFFNDLGIRPPDYYLGIKGKYFGEQIGKILGKTEEVMIRERPDSVLILGDTNSGLASIIAKRLGIVVYHMEAGNRCYDDRVPEEVNRRIIDHTSSILLPYTHRSKENLLREGIENERIYVTGNPINEVINQYHERISKSQVLQNLKVEAKRYFLITMHREENVDIENRLYQLTEALKVIQEKFKMPIICSLHPRTGSKIKKFNIHIKNKRIHFHRPFGFFDFIKLEKNAFCVLSDSGTVQEECCIFKVPNVTIRDVTERPETIECGSNILAGVAPENILQAVEIVLNESHDWDPPKEYLEENVSSTVVKAILSHISLLKCI